LEGYVTRYYEDWLKYSTYNNVAWNMLSQANIIDIIKDRGISCTDTEVYTNIICCNIYYLL
jgi:hypothetical protein